MANFKKWHEENPFGMFIHWGAFSITQYHSQYLMRMKADKKEYEKLCLSFNPTQYNPEKWVELAKNAGMKYICFTAKHHDGFCMWDTKATSYSIMNTPYAKDTLKMLQQACEKYGMKLSLYYSIPDWNQENAYNEKSTHQVLPRETDEPNMQKYKQYIKTQITELLTGYGEISTLFWDIPPKYEDTSLNELVRSLQPNILINDRGFDKGDFSTPERHIPMGELFKLPTEACQSVGRQSWCYRCNEDYYSSSFLTQGIDKVISMGGNYLLNIGPKPSGELAQQSIDIIEKVGNWYKSVEESFMTAQPVVLFKDKEKLLTTANKNELYLHFYEGINTSGYVLDPITVLPEKVTVLNDNSSPIVSLDIIPSFHQREDAFTKYLHIYDLPCESLTSVATVIKLSFKKDIDVKSLFEIKSFSGEDRF